MLLQAYIDETGFGPAGDDFGVAYAPSNVLTYAFLSHDMTCFSCVEYVSFLLLVIQYFSRAPCVFALGANVSFLNEIPDDDVASFIDAVKIIPHFVCD